jgi:hypothetical protein
VTEQEQNEWGDAKVVDGVQIGNQACRKFSRKLICLTLALLGDWVKTRKEPTANYTVYIPISYFI